MADGSVLSWVTSAHRKTGCANRVFNVQRPFRVCESLPRTTWMQGLSRAATKIKADAEHPARMSDPLGCCCNIGEMARRVQVRTAIAGCHYQRKMTLAERGELRRVGCENNATADVVCPAPREGRRQLRIRRYRHRCPAGGNPGRGVQGKSPLARDIDPAARGGG